MKSIVMAALALAAAPAFAQTPPPAACSAESAISPMPSPLNRSTHRLPTRRSTAWRSTRSASTRWTAAI
jgi:hypothetical protein